VSKPLVIVESPAKARTIGKFLGAGFTVKASMGHVRDLPRSGLHVYPEKRFDADWEPIKERTKIVSELRRALEKADTLYLATDPDREGEAIAWHLVELLADRKQKEGELDIKRVVFHEITKDAIKEAFDHPAKVNEDLVNAYRARRILDRLVGYQLSELLWRKLTRGLSAGRVQSVAVKLVVEREREIRAFVPEEYWKVIARFGQGEQAFTAEFKRLDGKAKELATVRDALAVLERAKGDSEQVPKPVAAGAAPARAQAEAQTLAEIRGGAFTLSSLKQAPKKVSAKPPFKTSTLQQAAAGRYGFTAKRTMRIAQQLYEGIDLPGEGAVGLITYMRTDSFNIALAARNAARDLIRDAWGERFLPEKPNSYRSREGAQEAHEAIRPTDPRRRPESVRKVLTEEQWKLYDLIWRRFIACQMAPAEYLVTTLELLRAGAAFAASGRVTTFPGFTQVYGLGGDKDEEQRLPTLTEGQTLDSTAVVSTQHFTTPPRRYSEASLVKALEEDGIGRPSTYASILSTIVDRRYVDHGEEAEMEARRTRWLEQKANGVDVSGGAAAGASAGAAIANGEAGSEADDSGSAPAESDDEDTAGIPRRRGSAYFATRLGEATTDLLEPQFGDIVNTAFTAQLEADLDGVAEGKVKWRDVLSGFYDRFSRDLAAAKDGMQHYRSRPMEVPEMRCDKVDEKTGAVCGAPMVVLFNRGGAYLGCSRYPDCSNNMPLTGQRTATAELTEFTCRAKDESGKLCGRQMERKVNRWGRPFLACTGYKSKECKGAVSVSSKGEPLWPVESTVHCPLCNRIMNIKRSRRGKFLACPGFPKCRGTLNLPSCPHTSKGGKVCGLPMTEPGPDGTLICREHPGEKLPPPAPRVKKAEGEEPGGEAGATGDEATAGGRAAKATGKPKPATPKRSRAAKAPAASKPAAPKRAKSRAAAAPAAAAPAVALDDEQPAAKGTRRSRAKPAPRT
jgi:DNA topoisomerase-1